MQENLLKIGLILLLVISTTGCAETVYLSTDYGTESITVFSDFWFYARMLLFGIIMFIGFISMGMPWGLDGNSPSDSSLRYKTCKVISSIVIFIVFVCIGLAFYPSGNNTNVNYHAFTRSEFLSNSELVNANQRYQEMLRLKLDNQAYQLKVQIDKAKTNIASLKQDRDQKVLPLKQNYSQMYDQYYPQLAQQLRKIRIQTHEELLKNCEQYLELCSSLNRVAKLQYYISKLDDKLKQIGANIIKLDDNVWNMERTFELSQIFSDEELEGVEKLIEETKGKIDSQVPPPEKQDVAGLEEQIFNDILRS